MCDDGAHTNGEWMEEHVAATERAVFQSLVLYLARKVPGFSIDEFREEAAKMTVEVCDRLDRNVVTEWMSAVSRAITGDMLPPQIVDEDAFDEGFRVMRRPSAGNDSTWDAPGC